MKNLNNTANRAGVIDFDSEAIDAAGHWHGGQSSMLYAIVSTGALSRGTQRPWIDDGIDGQSRPMTDAEWIAHLADDLEDEADHAIAECEKLLKSRKRNTSYDRDELRADLEGLQSIVWAIREWRNA